MYKRVLFFLWLAVSWCPAQTAGPAARPIDRGLSLDVSSMPLTMATATLTVGPLTRTNGFYVGDFKVKVFPYFFKSDWGRLAIEVPDAVLATMNQGKTVAISGSSTSSKNGIVRHITISAMPQDGNHGTVRLWFMADDHKMIFTTAYKFTGDR